MKDMLKEVEKKMQQEMDRQVDMNYAALALALYRNWGWKALRIYRLMDKTQQAWDECAGSNDVSMLQMLEEETGIEIKNAENGKSWHDLAYLNSNIDMGRMTRAQWIYMRQRQTQWIGPQVVACILLAMHRKEGFGPERNLRLLHAIEDIEYEFNYDVKALKEACLKETGVQLKKE